MPRVDSAVGEDNSRPAVAAGCVSGARAQQVARISFFSRGSRRDGDMIILLA